MVFINGEYDIINPPLISHFDVSVFKFICDNLKATKKDKIFIPFETFKVLSANLYNYEKDPDYRFKRIYGESEEITDLHDAIKSFLDKLSYFLIFLYEESKIRVFPFISDYCIDNEYENVTITIVSKARCVIYEFAENFSCFDLFRYFLLKSKYSKRLLRLLLSNKKAGRLKIDATTFRQKMCFPHLEYYDSGKFTSKCLKPAIEELIEKQCFKTITYLKRKGSTRGNPIIGYDFSFEYIE